MSNQSLLKNLNTSKTKLTTLDVTNNTVLEILSCQYSTLTSLDVSKNVGLVTLRANNNSLTELDISQLPNVSELDARNNNLTFLSLKNGNNSKIAALDVNGNPKLTCIEVTDVDFATANTKWKKDATASYSNSCAALSIDDNYLIENISLYPNPATSVIEVSVSNGLELKSIEIYNLVGKKILSTKNTSILVKDLASGFYFVKLFTNKGAINKRILKK